MHSVCEQLAKHAGMAELWLNFDRKLQRAVQDITN